MFGMNRLTNQRQWVHAQELRTLFAMTLLEARRRVIANLRLSGLQKSLAKKDIWSFQWLRLLCKMWSCSSPKTATNFVP
jgi:hypothetical protein